MCLAKQAEKAKVKRVPGGGATLVDLSKEEHRRYEVGERHERTNLGLSRERRNGNQRTGGMRMTLWKGCSCC